MHDDGPPIRPCCGWYFKSLVFAIYQALYANSLLFLFLLLALPRSHSTCLGQIARLKTTKVRGSCFSPEETQDGEVQNRLIDAIS
jgi:hypothetical protein